MAEIRAKTNVKQTRNKFGEFATKAQVAEWNAVTETVKSGARTSRMLAPRGKNRARYSNRPGYIPLANSIRTYSKGSVGYWYSEAPHALYVEFGTDPHPISGYLRFFWERHWRMFEWNNPNYNNWDESGVTINHPGTPAQPFLRPAFEKAGRVDLIDNLKKEYRK